MELLFWSIAGGIVGGTVGAHPEGHELQHGRPTAGARALDGLVRRPVHGEHVVAVQVYVLEVERQR